MWDPHPEPDPRIKISLSHYKILADLTKIWWHALIWQSANSCKSVKSNLYADPHPEPDKKLMLNLACGHTSKVIQSNEVQKEKIQLDLDFPKSITTPNLMWCDGERVEKVVIFLAKILPSKAFCGSRSDGGSWGYGYGGPMPQSSSSCFRLCKKLIRQREVDPRICVVYAILEQLLDLFWSWLAELCYAAVRQGQHRAWPAVRFPPSQMHGMLQQRRMTCSTRCIHLLAGGVTFNFFTRRPTQQPAESSSALGIFM
jgi:hypothetical protein